MIKTKNALLISLLLPILALATLTAYKRHVLNAGSEIILPISGYDPRDLLSGHYLIYRIDYGVNDICSGNTIGKQSGYVCLEPKMFSFDQPIACMKLIRGVCNYNRFEAGIEKYYVPEDKAKKLEERIMSKSASIVLSTTPYGDAQVKDLLINNKSWTEQE